MANNNRSDGNRKFNHSRAWFIAAINLIPNMGGAIASLFDSYSSRNEDNSEQLGAIFKEIQSIKASSQNRVHHEPSSARTSGSEFTQQEDPPAFKQIASIPAGTGLYRWAARNLAF